MSQATQTPWPYHIAYLALAGVALYHMHLGPTSQHTRKYLEPLIEGTSARFHYPEHPEAVIRQSYTGTPLDVLLKTLVTGFLAGPARFKDYIFLQQVNFLITLAPVIVFYSMESIRDGVGAGEIARRYGPYCTKLSAEQSSIPFYFIAHAWTFSSPTSTRPVPLSRSSTLLPSLIIGYLYPTALMYYPYNNLDLTMLATAFWRPSPLLVNLLWAIFASIFGNRAAPNPKATSTYFQRSLVFIGVVAAASHAVTLNACLSPQHPDITLTSIFFSIERSGLSFEEAAHFLFQIDYLVIFLSSTLFCVRKRREKRASVGIEQNSIVLDTLIVTVSTLVVGPGATLALMAYRREATLSGIKAE